MYNPLTQLNNMLQLTKPLSFFDIEATGTDTQKDRIIELAIIKVRPDGMRATFIMVFNPDVPIPLEASLIHGFYDADVKDKPLFKDYAIEIVAFLAGSDLAGFNSNKYDIPLLLAELSRAGVKIDLSGVDFVDAGVLYKLIAPRTLSAAHKDYIGTELTGAHGALADTEATLNVLIAMLERHVDELPLNVPELALKSNYGKKRLDISGKFQYRADGVIIITFGKHKDQPAFKEVSYLQWMIGGDFAQDTKDVAQGILSGTIK